MKKAIYYRFIALAFVVVLICGLITAMIYAAFTQNQTKEWLTKLTLSAAENYKYNHDIYELSKSAGNNRITIIAPDGRVLADSEANAADMENHTEREEVRNATTNSVTISIRQSTTLGERFMYASIKTADGNILRLVHSYPRLFYNIIAQFTAMLIAILVAIVLSLFLAGRFTQSVMKPLENMVDSLSLHEYEKLAYSKSPYYEIDKIIQSLQELLQRVTDSNIQLQDERQKLDYILSNMAEGFVLVDNSKNILLCNNSARDFFGMKNDSQFKNIYSLTRNQTIINALQRAIENKQSSIFDIVLKDGLIVNVFISSAKTTENKNGATMLMVDMTAEKHLEQQKRDFFSNASHELKTPITSIIGFSEMINKNLVKSDAEKDEIMGRIETEAKRMSELIQDILSISKLESKNEQREYVDINFSEIIREAVAAISPMKDDSTIEINMDLDNLIYRGDRRQLYELCVNLIENAVKYNKADGKVDISLKNDKKNLIFTVKDSGIGIALEYQARVFERFYRVDYGRNKKTGGSGLGLSIVKHIVNIYGGSLSLQSKKDKGTTIVVSLPL